MKRPQPFCLFLLAACSTSGVTVAATTGGATSLGGSTSSAATGTTTAAGTSAAASSAATTSGAGTSGAATTSAAAGTGTTATGITAAASSGASTAATTGATTTSASTTSSGAGIPATFFGMHVTDDSAFPVQVPFGYLRNWDSPGVVWQDIERCDPATALDGGCFDWTAFDEHLALAKLDAGIDETLFTMSRTPLWAAQDAGAVVCDYGANSCFPPTDLESDGSGTDLIWIGWATALGQHVNAPGYTAGHAHIHLYEPWNEFYRSPVLTGGAWNTTSIHGTFAQMVRLTEDLRCVIKGVGTLHNSPTVGQSTPCSQLLASLGQTAIDPSAEITTPSGQMDVPTSGRTAAMENFLYCDANPPDGSVCTGGDEGSQAVDVINFHLYPIGQTPEFAFSSWVAPVTALLSAADRAKPLISGEGSWGLTTQSTSIWGSDALEQAGFIPRYLALGWSNGMSQMFWYGYDVGDYGQLYSDGDDAGPGALKVRQADAWIQTHAWLLGAVPTEAPFCQATGTVEICNFLQNGAVPSRLVWDFSYGPQTGVVDGGACEQYADDLVCGAGAYFQDAGFTTLTNLAGSVFALDGGAITIGANPVLLQ